MQKRTASLQSFECFDAFLKATPAQGRGDTLGLTLGANGASSRRLGHAQASSGATLGLLHFFDRSVVFLKRFNSTVAVAGSGDALDGVVGTGEGRDVRNLVVDVSRPWLRFGHTKMQAFLCDTHLAHC